VQQQVPSFLVEAVKVGIGRGLLDDEDVLAEAQNLIQGKRREIIEAPPSRCDFWHPGQGIRHSRERGKPIPAFV
jgi:hypothetical protein